MLSLQNESIRETVCDENGRTLVIINLCYPALAEKKMFGKRKNLFRQRFCTFYRAAAQGFADFARSDLQKKAKKNPEGCAPCGAVLRWNVKEETEETVTVCMEGSVFDGTDTHPITKDTRTWEKKTGIILPAKA